MAQVNSIREMFFEKGMNYAEAFALPPLSERKADVFSGVNSLI